MPTISSPAGPAPVTDKENSETHSCEHRAQGGGRVALMGSWKETGLDSPSLLLWPAGASDTVAASSLPVLQPLLYNVGCRDK